MLNDLPLVSVLMPVYNGERTIQRALKSLIKQTYTNWKCIIVNDGSTDGTREILNSLNDNRFKIIHLPKNIGRGAARQIALNNAEGVYVAYLDADDFYHSEKLSIQVDAFRTVNDCKLISSVIGTFNNKNQLTNVRGKYGTYYYKFGDNLFFTPATSMVRLSDAILHNYNMNLNAAEDVDFFSRLLEGGHKYLVLENVLYYYEVETTSYSKILEYTKHDLKRLLSMITIIGIRAFFKALIVAVKYIIYLFFIPILGTDFFLSRRGYSPTNSQKKEFDKYVNEMSC